MAKLLSYLLALSFVALPFTAYAREQLRVVGSSTVFPFVAASAEQFGRRDEFRTPIVEATGTGGGIKIFCSGIGDAFPDMANASRQIKTSEVALCKKNGIEKITELKIGYDGIVLANAREAKTYNLERKTLYLALAREIAKDGKMTANPYKRWNEIDPSLPDVQIEVYGPPPSSGTRDAFVELVMEEGCKQVGEVKKLIHGDAEKYACTTMREDGGFVEAGEDDNLIVQKLINNSNALGIFGYSFLESNAAMVKPNAIDGVMPNDESIEDGSYHVARSLYVYVKDAHVGIVPGLREFAMEMTSDAASGEDGYLILKGLLPLNDQDHTAMKKAAVEIGN